MNNEMKLFVLYLPSRQFQGQQQKQHSVDTVNYIKDKQKHKDNSHRASLRHSTVEKDLFLPYTTTTA
jgi:hypothetical protein